MIGPMLRSLVVVVAAIFALCMPLAMVSGGASPEQLAAAATVVVADDEGHGSGVVIGHNLIATAKHVVDGKDSLKITFASGAKAVGHVLWTGKGEIDLAVLDAPTGDVAPAIVDCRKVHRGDRVFTHGHPMQLHSVTTWGHIASDAIVDKATQDGVLMDLTVLPGNSGGGVWGLDGRLVGFADAVLVSPGPMGLSASPTGLSVMVPATLLCRLMGR